MGIKEVKNYITKRYERWLDYSKYYCAMQGMAGEEVDLLNEVMISLLEKPEEKLLELYNKKHKQYRELDYFVLRMIKMNATSDTAPYRHKYKPIPVDANINYSQLEIEDLADDEEDRAGEILRKTRIIHEAIEDIEPYTDPLDIEAFCFRYFDGEPGDNWKESDMSRKICYNRSHRARSSIKTFVENYDTRRLKVKSIWYNFVG
jgi:hypothetical protein